MKTTEYGQNQYKKISVVRNGLERLGCEVSEVTQYHTMPEDFWFTCNNCTIATVKGQTVWAITQPFAGIVFMTTAELITFFSDERIKLNAELEPVEEVKETQERQINTSLKTYLEEHGAKDVELKEQMVDWKCKRTTLSFKTLDYLVAIAPSGINKKFQVTYLKIDRGQRLETEYLTPVEINAKFLVEPDNSIMSDRLMTKFQMSGHNDAVVWMNNYYTRDN